MQLQEQEKADRYDAYSLFVYAIRSKVTKDYYLLRLKIFFNFLNLFPNEEMETRCNRFALNGKGDPDCALNCIIRFLQFQKERVEREEITMLFWPTA